MSPEILDLMQRVQTGHTTCLRATEIIEAREEKQIDEMVRRFLSWRLPDSVCPDEFVMDRGGERFGTNFLSADEARQMVEHMLSAKPKCKHCDGTGSVIEGEQGAQYQAACGFCQ